MFLLDNLLLAPGKAAFFLIQELAKKAQEEWLDDETVKQELQQIYALLDAGKISDKEFEEREIRLVERLQQIAAAKLQQAGGLPSLPAAEVPMEIPAEVMPEPAVERVTVLPAEPAPEPAKEMSFASIAATIRPFLEMVGNSVSRPDAETEVGLMVQALPDVQPEPPPPPPPPPTLPPLAARPVAAAQAGMLPINEVVDKALAGLSMLRLKVSSVTSVSRVEDGWRVTAELVERRGVPDSSDLLGIYELRLDGAGNILQWERTRMRRRCDLGH